MQRIPAGEPLPPLPEGLWRYRVDHEHVVTGAAYSCGGNLFAWAGGSSGCPGAPTLEAALAWSRPAAAPADPRFGGDRPPGLAPAGPVELPGSVSAPPRWTSWPG